MSTTDPSASRNNPETSATARAVETPRTSTTSASESLSPPLLKWTQDHLGKNFQCAEIPLGKDPDGETDIVATLVKYAKTGVSTQQKNTSGDHPAILYVHGMSDYFFQTHVAEYFAELGYDFYAIDLRKCGRSWREGQTFHYITDLSFYFEELNIALNVIAKEHEKVIPMGHSTGGLIVALWLDYLRKGHKPEHAKITGAIFNSPWLDLMAPRPATVALNGILNVVGKKYPKTVFPLGALGTYGKSVHRDEQGFWDFNLEWKPIQGQPKYMGWLRTVLNSQRRIHHNRVDCGVPTLTLCSDKSYKGREFAPEAMCADSVLWVEQIQRWAPRISRNSTVCTVADGMHDVFLSGDVARNFAFQSCTSWLAAVADNDSPSK